MKITNVGSASFIIEMSGVKILCDPWFQGLGFMNGWSPLYSLQDMSLVKDIDYIWFSHEHPDHFHPPSLALLNKQWDSFPTVLFQKTINGRVKGFIEHKYKANVIELSAVKTLKLRTDLQIKVVDVGIYDSYLQIYNDDFCFTHLNDCSVSNETQLSKIADSAKNKKHILTSQYGLAHAPCGRSNIALLEKYRSQKVEQFLTQVKVIAPDYAIPSSSAIHFCSYDNIWMNHYRTNPAELIEPIKEMGGLCLLPLPEYQYDFEHVLDDIIQKNTEKSSFIIKKLLSKTNELVINEKENLVDFERLCRAIKICSDKIKSSNNIIILMILQKLNILLGLVNFYINDLNLFVSADPLNGTLTKLRESPEDFVSVSSYVLEQLYTSDYGVDALNASGRFDMHGDLTLIDVNNHLNICTINLAGIQLNLLSLIKPKVFIKLIRVFGQWYDFSKKSSTINRNKT